MRAKDAGRLWGLLGSLSLLLLGIVVYWPGLSGPFLFDDFPNLEGLAFLSQPLKWSEVLEFAFSGKAGVLGRPVAMFSFAAQAAHWPADPRAFKAVNLGLHLLNGVLVACLFARISLLYGNTWKSAWIAGGLVAGIWILHPIQVSTVLYVVQRMILLAAFFTLLALLAYIRGRMLLAARPGAGWTLILVGLGTGGALATLSKETGLLLPVLVLLLELMVPFPPLSRKPRLLLRGMLLLPLLLATGYVLSHLSFWWAAMAPLRDFSLMERLMTEPRVLGDYLASFFLPFPSRLGLFHDGYTISHGLLAPWTTLVALLVLTGIVVWLVRRPKAHRYAVFGGAWFLACHLLESTVLPLELYFEHRNYLAIAGLAYGLVMSLEGVRGRWPAYTKSVLALGGLWFGACLLITVGEARLWGNPLQLAAVWAQEHPESPRAQWHWAGTLLRLDRHEELAALYGRMAITFPSQTAAVSLAQRLLACRNVNVLAMSDADLERVLRYASLDLGVFDGLQQMLVDVENGRCQYGGKQQVLAFLAALETNPAYQLRIYALRVLRARFLLAFGDAAAGSVAAREAFFMVPDSSLALLWAGAAYRAGNLPDVERACQAGLPLQRTLPLAGQGGLQASCANLGFIPKK